LFDDAQLILIGRANCQLKDLKKKSPRNLSVVKFVRCVVHSGKHQGNGRQPDDPNFRFGTHDRRPQFADFAAAATSTFSDARTRDEDEI